MNEIPEFIKKSDLYKTLNETNDLTMIPRKYLKHFKSWIIRKDEFEEYLDFLQYWMVDKCPEIIYDYIFDCIGGKDRNQQLEKINEILDRSQLPFVEELKFLGKLFCDKFNDPYYVRDHQILGLIIRFDSEGLFDWALKHGYPVDYSTIGTTIGHKNKYYSKHIPDYDKYMKKIGLKYL